VTAAREQNPTPSPPLRNCVVPFCDHVLAGPGDTSRGRLRKSRLPSPTPAAGFGECSSPLGRLVMEEWAAGWLPSPASLRGWAR
jgi:hypothetical protein